MSRTPDDDHVAQQVSAVVGTLRGSLQVWGDWFGKPHDNFHILVGCSAFAEGIVLRFNEGETLSIWHPQNLVATPQSLVVGTATRVRWEWFYYGRSQTEENRRFRDYRVVGDAVSYISDFEPERQRHADVGAPAVQIS